MPKACDSTIEKVTNFHLSSVLERYARDQDLDLEQAKEHERELKRYFALVIDNPGTTYGMCGPIDELWHTFLMFTLLYQQFRETTAGRFIHHFPNDHSGDRTGTDERQNNYARFVLDYVSTFGEEPPRHLWPAAMETSDGMVAGCSTCRCCVAGS